MHVNRSSSPSSCRLGGVVVSVLATRPKGRGFKPCRDDEFFEGDKSSQHSFLRVGSKVGGLLSQDLRHVKRPLKYLRY
jgi:hypothetical protein